MTKVIYNCSYLNRPSVCDFVVSVGAVVAPGVKGAATDDVDMSRALDV